jgi:hypothetical protein
LHNFAPTITLCFPETALQGLGRRLQRQRWITEEFLLQKMEYIHNNRASRTNCARHQQSTFGRARVGIWLMSRA